MIKKRKRVYLHFGSLGEILSPLSRHGLIGKNYQVWVSELLISALMLIEFEDEFDKMLILESVKTIMCFNNNTHDEEYQKVRDELSKLKYKYRKRIKKEQDFLMSFE